MACYRPVHAYRSIHHNHQTGKWPTTLALSEGFSDYWLRVVRPCGQCENCRIAYASDWALRCHHEMLPHGDQNSFLTLTYNDDNLPYAGTLNPEHLTLFMKRLRKLIDKLHPGRTIRFYACGEYGTQLSRPHYHILIFGYQFPDLKLHLTKNGINLWRSELQETKWDYGYSTIGEVNYDSACYVARYCMKKINGGLADEWYEWVDIKTGLITQREPEFAQMSRGNKKGEPGGIGKAFFLKNYKDMYPLDGCIMNKNGKFIQKRIPRYYDSLYEKSHPELFKVIQRKRRIKAKLKYEDPEWEEKDIQKEQCKKIQLQKLTREYEELENANEDYIRCKGQ